MTKPKPTYRDPHTQIRNDVLINLCRANLSKRDYYRFLMILFRETFGRKRQRGQALGKWMEWEPKIWVGHGLAKNRVTDCKRELLELRVIRKNGTKIGFNWHSHQWKCDWYVEPLKMTKGVTESTVSEVQTDKKEYPQQGTRTLSEVQPSTLSEVQLYPQQGTVVPSPRYSTPSKPASEADPQSLKKQRNKETIIREEEEVKKGTKKSDQNPTEYTEAFELFWKAYPRKLEKAKAFGTFQAYYTQNLFTLEDLIKLVEKNNKELWCDREPQFIPMCTTWLNRRPWEDLEPPVESVPFAELESEREAWMQKLSRWLSGTKEHRIIQEKIDKLTEEIERRKHED